jgi:hypothetical protein
MGLLHWLCWEKRVVLRVARQASRWEMQCHTVFLTSVVRMEKGKTQLAAVGVAQTPAIWITTIAGWPISGRLRVPV